MPPTGFEPVLRYPCLFIAKTVDYEYSSFLLAVGVVVIMIVTVWQASVKTHRGKPHFGIVVLPYPT